MYQYFENFSSLFDENPSVMYAHHFENFEEMVQKCAIAAVRDTRLAWDNGRNIILNIDHDIDLNIPLIDKIIASYKRSCFGKGLSDFYINRVRNEFIFLIGTELKRSCYNQVHYDLILPVIFFRCIMLNEFNPETVKGRDSDLNKQLSQEDKNTTLPELSADNLERFQQDEKWAKRQYNWPKKYDSGEILSVKLYQVENNKDPFFKLLSEAEKEANKAKFSTNDAVPPAVRIACNGFFHLKDKYEIVISCSEYARVGCFLYDLLLTTANKNQPLDTILRLYMVAEVHDVLSCTNFIVRGEAYSGNSSEKERPLLRFDKTVKRQLMRYKSEEIPIQTEKLLKNVKSQKSHFLAFYDHLYTNYTYNAPEILEFYLDKTILEPCIGLDKTIKTYASNVKLLVSKLPYYENTVSHARTAIRMINLFREDKLIESWEDSDSYKIQKEAEEIFKA